MLQIMNTSRAFPIFGLAMLMGLAIGCEEAKPPQAVHSGKPGAVPPGATTSVPSLPPDDCPSEAAPVPPPPKQSSDRPEVKKVKLGASLHLEVQGEQRRVLVDSIVVLREVGGIGLECLVCKKGTKEHESILATEAKAKEIHAALEACRAKAGHPFKYEEKKFIAPTGTPIRITLRYEDKDKKVVEVSAREWVQNAKTKKPLEHDWVFAGSTFYKNFEDATKPPIYAAEGDGGYICVANVISALMDLPINSPKGQHDRGYIPFTEKIPEIDTPVTIILEPIVEKK